MTYFRCFILWTLMLVSGCSSAFAEPAHHTMSSSAWQTSEGGRLRLWLIVPEKPAHSLQGVIDIELHDGWKTYWRNPGNSGMAPYFTLQKDAIISLFYPAPQNFGNDNDWSTGYSGHVLLPFQIHMHTERPTFTGRLTVGMCQTICLPISIDFDFDLKNILQRSTPSDEALLSRAFKALPKAASENFSLIAAHEETDQKDMLVLTLKHPPSSAVPELFLDGGETEIGMASIVQHQQTETVFNAPILYKTPHWDKTLFYTAKIGDKAVSGEINSK